MRVINFGTRTPAVLNGVGQDDPGLPGSAESFPLYIGGEGSVIEDCVMEQPFLGTARETTIIAAGGAFRTTAQNNFIDAAFVNPRNGFPTRVTGVSSVGTAPATITVTTQFPHNVKEGDFVEVKGATPAGYNGRWLVKTPASNDGTSRVLSFDIPTALGTASGSITVEQSFQPTMRVSGAVWASGVLTITTADKHFRKAGDWVVISGANVTDVAGVATDLFNGSYQVGAAGLTDTAFQVACAGDGVNSPTGELWVDRRMVEWRVKDIDRDADFYFGMRAGNLFRALTFSEETATVVTYAPHNLKPGEYFLLGPVLALGSFFNSYFAANRVLDRLRLVIEVPLEVESLSTWEIIHTRNSTNFQGISAHGSSGSTMERNRLLNVTRGAYHDTWAAQDAIIRKNYFYNVGAGCYMILGGDEPASAFVRTGSITAISATEISIQTTGNPSAVYVFGVGLIVHLYQVGGTNAYLEITSAVTSSGPGTYIFKLKKPASNPFVLGADVSFSLIGQQKRTIVEGNLFDLAHQLLPSNGIDFAPAFAVSLASGVYPAPGYLYKEVIVRGNLIRPRDNVPDPHVYRNMTGMRVAVCEQLVAEGNVMNLMFADYPRAFATVDTIRVKTFNNQDEAGGLVRVFAVIQDSPPLGTFVPDLYDEAENWLLGRL